MDWMAEIDGYCERLTPHFWAEPINAITNLAFIIAALFMAQRVWKDPFPIAKTLVVMLALIGIGSFLFHTFATAWASLSDVVPIVGFILIYLFAANRDFIGLPLVTSLVAALLFLPVAAALVPVFAYVPILNVSAGYLPVALLIAGYSIGLRKSHPTTAQGLGIGASLLFLSIILRSLDEPLCTSLPFGTHFAWHLLNAVLRAWMIEIYRRHMLARPAHQR